MKMKKCSEQRMLDPERALGESASGFHNTDPDSAVRSKESTREGFLEGRLDKKVS